MLTRTLKSSAATAVVPLLVLLVAAPRARAQALADRVPQDAILYVGWNGAAQMGPGYEGSNLKGVLEGSDFPKLFDQFLPQLMQKIGQEERDAQEVMNLVSGLAKPMWKHPTAFFFAGVQFPPAGQDNQPPTPKLGLICKAGADADDLHNRIQGLLNMQDTPAEVRQFVKSAKVGDSVVVTVGMEPNALPGGGGGAGNALVGNQTFRATLAQTGKIAPVGIFYLDAEKLQSLVAEGLNRYAGGQQKDMWAKVQTNLGLKGLKRVMWTSGFDGKDWQDNLFVHAPEPRSGILSIFGTAPLSEDALKNVPATATMAGAAKFDANKFLNGLRDLAAGFDPNAAREFDNAMAEASRAIGMDVQKDVLANFGDEWVYYADPGTGGRSMLGCVLINRLKDPAKAEQSLTRLQDLIAREVNKQMNREGAGGGGPQPKLSFYTTRSGDTTIHYVGTPLITPSWAIKNGNLYCGLFPQAVAAAAGHVPGRGKSILDNQDFTALRQRLGAQQASAVGFMDLPRTAPDSYAQWVMISRLVGFGDMLGVQSPAMLLPPLPKLMQHLSPAGSAAWSDKDGWHMRSITPFPGSTIFASDPTASMMTTPLMMSVLLPSLNRAREQANRVKSSNNLRQIALGALLYANENRGRMPSSLGEILKTQEVTLDVFLNPRTGTQRPLLQNPQQEQAWVNEQSDYAWIGTGLTNAQGADFVVAYEKPTGLSDGINVAFADAHVEFLTMEQARRQIGRQAELRRQAGLPPGPPAPGFDTAPAAAPPPGGRPAPPRINPPPTPPRPTPPAPRPPRAPQPPR